MQVSLFLLLIFSNFIFLFFLADILSPNYVENLRHRLSVDSTRDVSDYSDDENQNCSRSKQRVRRNIDEVSLVTC